MLDDWGSVHVGFEALRIEAVCPTIEAAVYLQIDTGLKTQKTNTDIFIAVRTSNLLGL
jgi:hypothetical protein